LKKEQKNKPTIIAITGPESCGKSTLTKQLGNRFKATTISEYAREYLEKTQGKYTFEDLEKIARGQIELLSKAKLSNSEIIIMDTELTVIKNWSEYKYHKISPWIQTQYENQKIDLYLLCNPDLPWEDDPLRESKNDRHEIFELYVKELEKLNRNYVVISGFGESRKQKAIDAVNKYLSIV